MKQDTTLLEKEVLGKKKGKLELEKESALKLFSKLEWADFNYRPFRNETSFLDLTRLKAYQYSCPASMMPATAGACERLANPLGSAYANLFGSSSYGLPCDLGLMR